MSHVIAILLMFLPLSACFLCAGASEHAGSGEAGANQIVNLDNEPHHHFAMQNDKVRIFKVSVAPHTSTLVHQHDRDYVFVSLGKSDISNEVVGKAPVEVKLKDGQANFTKGGFAHLAKNLADTPFRNVTVELMQPAQGEVKHCDENSQACEIARDNPCVVAGIVDCATTHWVVDAENFRMTETRIPPSLKLPKQAHASNYLLIAITDLDLRDPAYGANRKQLSLKEGDAVWMPSTKEAEWKNSGKTTARFLTVEFK